MTDNLVTQFRYEVRRCLEVANAKYNLYELIKNNCIAQDINVSFYTAGNSAGWASHFYEGDKIKKLSLRFNSYFIETNYNYMVNDTIPHEIAHILCYLLYPKQDIKHGIEWNKICINLGGSGKRYHNMNTLKTTKKQVLYEYNIDGKSVYIPSKVHFKAQKSFTNHSVNGIMTRVFSNMYTGNMYTAEK